MSASPADRTPGRTPNGTVLPLKRRPKPPVDPMVRPRKRQPRPPPKPQPQGLAPNSLQSRGPSVPHRPMGPGAPLRPKDYRPGIGGGTLTPANQQLGILDDAEPIHSGFTSEPVAPFVDYPLVLTKRQFAEGLRAHVARFYSKKSVDPTNEEDFTRPVRLHRKDARAPVPGVRNADGDPADGELDEERERNQQAKAQREAEREALMAEVAPSANSIGRRLGPSNKKTEQVFRHDQTEEQRARTKLRYEEALQWHLEDFDNKQCWQGNYEEALSETYAQISFKDGKFTVVPVEKWYKFTPRTKFKQLDLEEAEKRIEKEIKDPRWFQNEQAQKKQVEQMNKKATSKLFIGRVVKEESTTGGTSMRRESDDVNELDFEEDRFADDEEPTAFEGDEEDVKQVEQRIKKDQLQANFFDNKDEKDYDKAEQLEKKLKQAEKEHGKRVRKALMKRERNFVYDSDSDNPYSEKSENTDSEAERVKEQQRKEDLQKKEAGEKAVSPQPMSGTSTKGNNTPSNRPSKHLSVSHTGKRVGSANVSDASGNESSRKLLKKQPGGSKLGTGTNTPNGNTPRSRSPANLSAPTSRTVIGPDSLKKRPRGGGSGSEGEGAGSGGDMSDGTRKRIKMTVRKPNSGSASPPGGSRSPSVEPRDRAGSPDELPSVGDIRAAIPDAGISLSGLLAKFKKPNDPKAKSAWRDEFLKLLKTISQYDKQTKMLKRIKTQKS